MCQEDQISSTGIKALPQLEQPKTTGDSNRSQLGLVEHKIIELSCMGEALLLTNRQQRVSLPTSPSKTSNNVRISFIKNSLKSFFRNHKIAVVIDQDTQRKQYMQFKCYFRFDKQSKVVTMRLLPKSKKANSSKEINYDIEQCKIVYTNVINYISTISSCVPGSGKYIIRWCLDIYNNNNVINS